MWWKQCGFDGAPWIYIYIYIHIGHFFIYIKMRWFDPILSAEIETVIPSVAWLWQQSSTLPPVFPATAGGRANHRGLVWGQTDRRRTERRAMDCHVKGGGTCQLCFGSQQANKTLPCSLAANELPRLRTSLQQTSALTRQHFPALLCFWTTAVRHLSFFFIPSLSVLCNTCAPRRAYVRGRETWPRRIPCSRTRCLTFLWCLRESASWPCASHKHQISDCCTFKHTTGLRLHLAAAWSRVNVCLDFWISAVFIKLWTNKLSF